ncbi:restriction endonuclease fold toxin [Amycolatopsis saalfeldensis]|uniref:Restriction endonuclease fold toxin 3 n=1 Tax=Amycolatopsis saalfeldensis TaxID=394193 RepID=A0A1H8YNI6_9PSEU|nr:restriction endonuclease fold toxin [Amycolatopsis saalfeldensis]SEP53764.1 Restriction endonuclease fold toxin 3 [Amycolatopsis saalfeldensis]
MPTAALVPGIQLDSTHDRYVTVVANRRYAGNGRTYNLTINGLHTYYIETGGAPVLVHNNDGDECINGGLGALSQVNKPDAAADELAAKLGGVSRVKFANDPDGREFDAISDLYVAQTKSTRVKMGSKFRNQARMTFEFAKQSGRIPFFHFEVPPDPEVLAKIAEYGRRYGIDPVVKIGPLG